jgi:hypothetical protein
MKGYVELIPDKDIIERIRRLHDTAEKFIDEFDSNEYRTPVYGKKYWLFGEIEVRGYKYNSSELRLPYGVYFNNYEFKYTNGDLRIIGYILRKTDYIQNSYKIVSLYDASKRTESILLDDELASIYNKYKKDKNE